MLDEDSTYRILPGFVKANDPSLTGSVNGWNDHLERWILDIQKECNRHYVMLIETARSCRIWKWIFLGLNIGLAAAAVLVTAIAIALGKDGIWLPIYSAVSGALGSALFTVFEAMDFNSWGYECRNSAGEYIILGRNIESIKRVPRDERDRPGLLYTNDASITFETIRANQPPIPDYIRKRHKVEANNRGLQLNIPMEYLSEALGTTSDIAARGDVADVEDQMERGESVPPKGKDKGESEPVALHDMFLARLEKVQLQREENDELTKYENYIRRQYKVSDNEAMSPRSKVAKPDDTTEVPNMGRRKTLAKIRARPEKK